MDRILKDFIDSTMDGWHYIATESDISENPMEILRLSIENRKAIALQRIADALSGYHDSTSDYPAISEAITMLSDANAGIRDVLADNGGD